MRFTARLTRSVRSTAQKHVGELNVEFPVLPHDTAAPCPRQRGYILVKGR